MNRLTEIDLSGFKTIKELKNFKLNKINIMIGANGSGKSNFITFFKLLNWMTGGSGNLKTFIASGGGASSFLFESPKKTKHIVAKLSFQTDQGENEYCMSLSYAAMDTLIFAQEQLRFSKSVFSEQTSWNSLNTGHSETGLIEASCNENATAKAILQLLRQCSAYQFHDTSNEAAIKQIQSVTDNVFLRADGGNLASYLLWMREFNFLEYSNIVSTLQLIAPFFDDFILEPNGHSIILRWRERNSDTVFGPHQASDGTLRTMALITLLLQPEEKRPAVIIIDEPELGLHPSALNIVSGLIKSAATKSQIILATQSPAFIDYFTPEDIIVVERSGRESTFKRLSENELKEWLDDYSIAELWEKNVIGGRP